jgi:uncharacterized peroxidase-related enzyme
MNDHALSPVNQRPLGAFVQDPITWLPWLDGDQSRSDTQWVAAFGPRRSGSPAFRLSAWDEDVGKGMAAIEDSIFDKAPGGGLSRGYRELGALTASRLNGCQFCVSHHSGSTARLLADPDAVRRILQDGVDSPQCPEWRAVMDAAIALTRMPISFGQAHIDALRGVGFDDGMILDLVHAVAYFNSANRFLLSLGETTLA